MSDVRRRVLCLVATAAFLSGAAGLFLLWSGPARRGIAALQWPTAPAEILRAEFRSDYDPDSSGAMDTEVRDTSAAIAVAYRVETPAGTRHYQTRHFDAFGPRQGDAGLMAGEACEVRAVLRAGDGLRVHYNPSAPDQAVIEAGIPHYTSCLLLMPWSLLGLALATLNWALRPTCPAAGARPPDVPREPGAASGDAGPRPPEDLAWLFLWGLVLPFTLLLPLSLLRPAWVWMFGCVPPWWIFPSLYLLTLLLYVTPTKLLAWKPVYYVVGLVLAALLLALPTVILSGLIASFAEPTDRGFGWELSDADCVTRLDHASPIVARWASREIVRRRGPRRAVPGLRRLLDSPDIQTREVAVSALRKVGAAALAALDDLEARARQPRNAEIREEFEAAIRQLRNCQAMQEKVRGKCQLLQDPSETTRLAAAFWLGHVGELAAPALPDLEAALADPRNRNIRYNVKQAILQIRHAVDAHRGTDVAADRGD